MPYIRTLWLAVPPPRGATVVMAAAYILLIVQGVWGYFQPGDGAEMLDPFVRLWVFVLLIGGGIIGLISLPWGIWMLEKAALVMVAGTYLVHLYWVLVDMDGNGVVEPGKACRMGIILLFLAYRFIQTYGRDLDPTHTGRICSKRAGGA